MNYNILMEVQDSIPNSPRVNDFLEFFVSHFSDWLCVLFAEMAVLASRRLKTRKAQVFTDQNGNPDQIVRELTRRKKITIFFGAVEFAVSSIFQAAGCGRFLLTTKTNHATIPPSFFRGQAPTSLHLSGPSTMNRRIWFFVLTPCLLGSAAGGCASHRDELALFGGLSGATIGTALSKGGKNAPENAALGAAVGAITGAVVGDHLDEVEARNQALFEQELGRRLAGTVTYADVISMSQAGLTDQVITTHIARHGVAQAPSAADLIMLKQNQVSDAVIQALQAPPISSVPPPGAPVIVEEHYIHGAPYRPYCPPRHHYYHRQPHAHWGISFSN